MLLKNFVSSASDRNRRNGNVISARKAAELLNLADNTFFKVLAAGTLEAQAVIEGEKRNAYGFERAYIDEVIKLLPKDRTSGQTLFTAEIISKLKEVNKKWSRLKKESF